MPKVTLVLYNIKDKTEKFLAAKPFDDILDYAAEQKLPLGMYTATAPYIGRSFHELGITLSREKYIPDLIAAINACIELGQAATSLSRKEELKRKLIIALNTYEISFCIISQLYNNLIIHRLHIAQYKEVFLFLSNHGAAFDHIPFPENKSDLKKQREIFSQLISNILGANHATRILGNINVGDPDSTSPRTGYGYFIEAVDYFLELGAHLNGVSMEEPGYGTFLHRYLANELPFAVNLINLLESKRQANKPNTQFVYTAEDSQGKTPLIIAIATRNIKAIERLLQLNTEHHINIGINMPDQYGRTPLMLACAFGLSNTVNTLLALNANPAAVDLNGKNHLDYLTLAENRDEEWKILSMMVHPERAATVHHSYLSATDTGISPFCLYEDNENFVTGDEQINHFVVLSPLKNHQARIQQVESVLIKKLEDAKRKGDTPLIAKISKDLIHIKQQNQQALESQDKTFITECRAGRDEISVMLKPKVKKLN